MNILSEESIAALLEGSAERRTLEFKPAFSWADPERLWLKEAVTRAVLGMTNNVGGGTIVLGVEQDAGVPVLKGMPPDCLTSFANFDAIKKFVDSFASLGTDFDISRGHFGGADFVVLTVKEFDRRPVICLKDGESQKTDGKRRQQLRRNAIYCRPRRGEPQTAEVTDAELEELIWAWATKRRADGLVLRESATAPETLQALYLDKLKDLE